MIFSEFKEVMKISTLALIYRVTDMVLLILQWTIIIRAFLSWIPHSPNNPIAKIIYDITEPLLKPFRLIKIGMIDLSPVFAIIALYLLRSFVLYPLFGLIAKMLF